MHIFVLEAEKLAFFTFWAQVHKVANGEKGNSIDYTSLVLEAVKVVYLLNISDDKVAKRE